MQMLARYLHDWGLSQPEKLTSTPTSDVYRVEFSRRPAVLKLLTTTGVADESGGAPALAYFRGKGAPILYRADERAHLLEFVPGPNLRDSSDADEQLVEVIQQLHGERSPPIPTTLQDLTQRFRSLFRHAEQPQASAHARDAAEIAKELLAEEENVGLLHGDLHHENILRSERGWLAIDPKGLIGERTYDLANLFYNPRPILPQLANSSIIRKRAKFFARELGYDAERILKFAFAYGHLSAAWMEEDGHNPEAVRAIAAEVRNCF